MRFYDLHKSMSSSLCDTWLQRSRFPFSRTLYLRPRQWWGASGIKGLLWTGSRAPSFLSMTGARSFSWLFVASVALCSFLAAVDAQPSPNLQRRISAAIKAAAHNGTNIDYTQFVNVFIGTDNFGDVW